MFVQLPLPAAAVVDYWLGFFTFNLYWHWPLYRQAKQAHLCLFYLLSQCN